jgi:membrane protease YdiL (CAAX protease family)
MTLLNDRQPILTPSGLLAVCVLFMVACWVKFLLPTPMQYGIDYAERVVLIGMIIVFGGFRFRRVVFSARTAALTGLTIVLALGLFYADEQLGLVIPILGGQVWSFSDLESDPFFYFDLIVGLALVALSEELVFRYQFVRSFPNRVAAQYLLSTFAFALIHVPQGVTGVVVAGLAGLLLMGLYRATGALAAPIVAHYLIDLILFAGWIE